MQLTISIDRAAGKIAVFRGFEVVKPFVSYTDEAFALAWAQSWCAANGDPKPEVVYPRIDSVRTKTVKRKR